MSIHIALLGKKQSGKTCMTHSYIYNKYENHFSPTISTSCYSKDILIDGQHVKLRILDNTGSTANYSVIQNFCTNVYGFMFVFDISDIDSFNELYFWLNLVKEWNIWHQFESIIVGNKCDCINEREVSKEKAQKMASDNGFHYFEVSAKELKGLDDAFCYIATQAFHISKLKKNISSSE